MIQGTIVHRAAVALLGAMALLAAAVPASAELRAGAGRADIDLPADLLPIQGFGVQRDPLQVRVLVLENDGQRLALAVVDLTSISSDEVAAMKAVVAKAATVDAANVVISASHTFSAPHIMPAGRPFPGLASAAEQTRNVAFKATVEAALRDAAARAATAVRPARLGFGKGVTDINVNRDQHTPEGFWLGVDSAGASDKELAVIRIEDLQRRPLAILANYAVQPSVMDQSVVENGTKVITADLAGAAMRRVEALHGEGLVSFFLIGAAGDQAPTFKARRAVADKDGRQSVADIGSQGYLLIDLLGERLAQDVIRTSEHVRMSDGKAPLALTHGVVTFKAQARPKSLQDLRPTKTYAFVPEGEAPAPYLVLRLGDIAVVGVQVELSSLTGQRIKQGSPVPNTIVATMVDGAAKYMPDVAAYDRITYEAMNSSYARGSAEVLQDAVLEALRVSAPRQ
ncbi:hypothetical protein [Caulobacter sp. LARHSG274]